LLEKKWEHFFKPEVRKAGRDLLAKKIVVLGIASDRHIEAFIRSSTAYKVVFKSDSIASPEFTVDCNCSLAKKGQFCKHIWATLVLACQESGDFFDSKKTIEKKTNPKLVSQKQIEFKNKQNEYRKQLYQVQKNRAKNLKEKKASQAFQADLPAEVLAATKYFQQNGFPMDLPFQPEAINNAKRILSRIFHPDKGGSQEEILTLLAHADVLLKYA
jgi:hypothetical protein